MNLKFEIKELERELNNSISVKKYDKTKNGSKSVFWENQAHDMQINKSILDANVRPFLSKLLVYSERVDEILLENERLKIELEKTKRHLVISKSRNKKNRDNAFRPYQTNKNHARGGCKLTDNQIKRLLMIYAKRGKYSSMSLNQAIKEISQTKNTYYKVINLDYRSEATRERIKAIARENDIYIK